MEAVRPALGIVDQHAVVVGEAGKLVNFELGHGLYSRAFACFLAVEPHPNSAILRIQPLRRRVQRSHHRQLMQHDVVELRDFYNRPLGGIVRRLLTQPHPRPLAQRAGRQLMGLGFAVPYIGMFRGEAARLGALMPAGQGALVWPPIGQWPHGDGRGGHAAAGRRLRRPAARACIAWRSPSASGRCCARSGACWRRRAGCCCRAEPARHLGPPRHHAVRPRPPLQPRPARAAADGCAVHAAGMDERALHAAASTGSGWCAGRPRSSAWAPGCGRHFAGVIIVEASKELMGAIPKGAPARAVKRLAEAQGGSLERGGRRS